MTINEFQKILENKEVVRIETAYPRLTQNRLDEIDKCINAIILNALPKEPMTASGLVEAEKIRNELKKQIKPLLDIKLRIITESPVSYLVEVKEKEE